MAALGKIALGHLRFTSPSVSSFGDFKKVGEPSQRLQRIASSSPTGKSEKILASELQRGARIGSLLERGERVAREGRRERRSIAMEASGVTGNGVAITDDVANTFTGERVATVARKTKETDVTVTIGLDGTGICKCDTGIPFLDHMIDQLASHGLFDVAISAKGDLHIDDHHTNEDIALALGTALAQALGDRKGIHRFGDFSAPLDEALIHVVLDLSGRPHLSYDLVIPTDRVGTYETQLVEHFFQSLANNSGMTLHIRQLAGKNSHHIIEATFKAFARALRRATEQDPRRSGTVPSSKGVLTQS